MKLWKFHETDVCPLCDLREDNYHVLRYNSDIAKAKWNETILNLESSLLGNHTPQEAVEIISAELHTWRRIDTDKSNIRLSSLNTDILARNLIGWQTFMEGCISIKWG